jgi:hypothetical protein
MLKNDIIGKLAYYSRTVSFKGEISYWFDFAFKIYVSLPRVQTRDGIICCISYGMHTLLMFTGRDKEIIDSRCTKLMVDRNCGFGRNLVHGR